MRGVVAPLLRGPDRPPGPLRGPDRPPSQASSWHRLPASAPILLFALVAAASGASAIATIAPASVLPQLAMATATTLICLCVGLPVSLSGLRLPWQLPLWLLLCAAPAAWARAAAHVDGPIIDGPMVEAVGGAATLLPVMVLCLQGLLAAIPATTGRSAACAGAGRMARFLHVWLPLAWPAALRASLVVFLLALALPWLIQAGLIQAGLIQAGPVQSGAASVWTGVQ